MTASLLLPIGIGAAVVLLLAGVPLYADGYGLSLGIGVLSYAVLATAWAMFSGPTRYISLATVAFFGVGAYTVAVLGEVLPWPLVLLAAGLSGVLLSLVVGLATMRLAGAYFVIFTFGLTELIRQLVTWYEVKISHTIGRYVFLDITQAEIYWQLLALGAALFLIAFLIERSRLGFTLKIIGGDETVARHVGVDVTRVKVGLFAAQRAVHDADRRDHGAPLDLYRSDHRLQPRGLVPGGDHGAARRRAEILGTAHRRHSADAAVRISERLFPQSLLAHSRPRVPGHRLSAAARFCRPAGAWKAPRRTPPPPEGEDDMNAAPILEVQGMRKAFGGLVAVRDVSFAVQPGEVVGLIGPNGSGKTTLINLMSGMIRPDRGAIRLGGCDIRRTPVHRRAKAGIARTFQLVRVIGEMTALENVVAGLLARYAVDWHNEAREEAEGLLARVGLQGKANVPASDLTYGDQKRVELARALALRPRLLLLDEWLAGLNAAELQAGITLIASVTHDAIAIIMVEHVMAAIHSLCGRCIVMSSGAVIADGPTADVMTDRHVIAAYLGDDDA